MSKLLAKEKIKNIDIVNIDDFVVLFIEDDTNFPSKIISIKLSESETKKLIAKLKYRLKKLGEQK